MNILLAGYGSVERAVHTILKAHPPANIAEVLVAEKTTGTSAEAVLADHGNSLDLVVNLTDDSNFSLLNLCRKYGLHYLETDLIEFMSGGTTRSSRIPCYKSNSTLRGRQRHQPAGGMRRLYGHPAVAAPVARQPPMSTIPAHLFDIVEQCLETVQFTVELHDVPLLDALRDMAATFRDGSLPPCFGFATT
ncbi:hypothetical protein [Desulfobulbus sp.]|uniref:hypothetical protein n=1 Tax=Desulfobulbus sp. TaxID=895 RepID=UPI00286EC147|nr:hypothetical protein [Desulfobulbus sp.]